jgi:hypothetical protein
MDGNFGMIMIFFVIMKVRLGLNFAAAAGVCVPQQAIRFTVNWALN